MADRYIKTYNHPPRDNDIPTGALLVRDVDDENPISSDDILNAKWKVETISGKSVRMTTGDILAHSASGSIFFPTYATNTAYPRHGAFVEEQCSLPC